MTDRDDPATATDPDPRGEYEQQWEDTTEKELLVGILAEQQRQTALLTQLLSTADATDTDASEATEWRCTKCGRTVPEDDRERHAREQHNAPPGDETTLFEVVE